MTKIKDYAPLVEAVERYINSSDYPRVETIVAILGIENKKVCLEAEKSRLVTGRGETIVIKHGEGVKGEQ